MEPVYNASGLGLPVVMTLANRAVGAPINIWNDHSDAIAARDAGWVQLFAETVQEAADLHIQAFRLAEEVSAPVMVCMDGFILTHATERVDSRPRSRRPRPARLRSRPGAGPGGPLLHRRHGRPRGLRRGALPGPRPPAHGARPHRRAGAEFAEAFGRGSGGLVHPYRSADADVVVVAMGSVLGTMKDVVDAERAGGHRIGAVGITSFRPFPIDAVRNALQDAKQVVVVEKAISVGFGGVLSTDVAMTLTGLPVPVATVVAGLGGHAITKAPLGGVFEAALKGALGRLTFLDLNTGLVEPSSSVWLCTAVPGPTAENMLRDLGVIASGIG